MSPEALGEALAGDRLSPVYLIHGSEPFLIDRSVEMIVQRALGTEPDRLNLEVFSAEEAESREITLSATAYPMLGGRRVVLVRDVEKVRDTGHHLAAYVADPSQSTVLVLTSSKPDFRQKLFQNLQKHAMLVECRAPYDDRMPAWIEAEARRRGRSVSREAAELIHLSAGRSLTDIGNELDKLLLYAGERKSIDVDDVSAVVGISRNFSIFDLQKAVGRGDSPGALEILARMMERGENMTGCVVQLTRYFEKLWLLPDGPVSPREAADLTGVREFFARDYIAARRRYPPSRIEDCFRALREADLRLKTSAGTPRVIMTILLHRLLTGAPPDGGPGR